MASIAKLSVQLTARIGPFAKKLQAARKRFLKFSKGIREIVGRVAKATAFAVVAAVAAITALAIKSAGAINDLQKFASTIDIAVDKLRGLEFAAKLAGVETKAFRKGLQNMVRNIQEVSTGTGEASDALELLRVDTQKLNRLKPDEQFLAIAKAMANLTNHADKVAAAYDIFGGRGVMILNVLGQGEKAIKATIKEMSKLRGEITRFDTFAIEEAFDAFDKVKQVVGGLGDQVAIQLAPSVTKLADAFVEAITAGEQLRETSEAIATSFFKIGSFISRWVARPLLIVRQGVDDLAFSYGLLQLKIEKFAAVGSKILDPFGVRTLEAPINKEALQNIALLESSLNNITIRSRERIKRIKELGKITVESIQDFMAGAGAETARRFKAGEEVLPGIELSLNDLKALKKVQSALAAQERVQADARKRIFDSTRTVAEKFSAEQERLNELLKKGVIDTDLFSRAIAKAKEPLLRLAQAAKDKAAKALEELAKPVNALKERAARIFEETRTPLEQFEARVTELQSLFSGKFLDRETFGRAMNQARKDLDDATKSTEALNDALEKLRGEFRQGKARLNVPGVGTIGTSASARFGNPLDPGFGRRGGNVTAVDIRPAEVTMIDLLRGIFHNTRNPVGIAG